MPEDIYTRGKCCAPNLTGNKFWRCVRPKFHQGRCSPTVLNADDGSAPRFVAVKQAVMEGALCVAEACSKTMAKRIANALNKHKPNSEGV